MSIQPTGRTNANIDGGGCWEKGESARFGIDAVVPWHYAYIVPN